MIQQSLSNNSENFSKIIDFLHKKSENMQCFDCFEKLIAKFFKFKGNNIYCN